MYSAHCKVSKKSCKGTRLLMPLQVPLFQQSCPFLARIWQHVRSSWVFHIAAFPLNTEGHITHVQ